MAKEFNVRVSIAHNGMTSHRTFTRGDMRVSRQAFCEFALGNMLTMILTGYSDSLNIGNGITGNYIETESAQILGYSVEVVSDANTDDEIDSRFRARFGY